MSLRMPKRVKEDFGVLTRGSTPLQLKRRKEAVELVKESGFHVQQWRVSTDERGEPINLPSFPLQSIKQAGTGINLGPMGELGDDIIVAIKLKIHAEYKYVMGVDALISKQEIVNLFKRYFYTPVKSYLDKDTAPSVGIVPTDRGYLSEALRKSYQEYGGSSNLNYISAKEPLKIVLGARGIPYGKVVNQMPTDWLKHPGTHGVGIGGVFRTDKQKKRRTTSRHSKGAKGFSKLLFDPMAKTHFYDELLYKSRRIAKNNFLAFKREIKNIMAFNNIARNISKGKPLLSSRKISTIVEKELFDIIIY